MTASPSSGLRANDRCVEAYETDGEKKNEAGEEKGKSYLSKTEKSESRSKKETNGGCKTKNIRNLRT